jgi:crotonobetainyl-CoA:carnitine CoA-transferase CaiB-like acyl-CoA transferase
MKFSESPERELKSPPSLGQHTTEILWSIGGLSDEDIEELIRAKVVHTHAAS